MFKIPNELTVGTATAKRGELQKGIIKGVELFDSTRIDIPVLVMNGVRDGPTVLMVSTQHGTEIQGAEVIIKVMREKVDSKALRGALIGIPVENPLAYMHSQYLSWIDNQDPGGGGSASPLTVDKPDGTATERLAHALWNEAWIKADMILNFHCNTRPDSLIFQKILTGNPKTRDDLWKMAKAFGVTTIVDGTPFNEDGPPTLVNLAAKHGKPAILLELIDGRWISEPSTSAGIRGVLNIMKAFDMIDGEIEPQEGFPIIPGVCKWQGVVRANRGGLIRFVRAPGDFLKEGEVFAEIYNLHGDILEEAKIPVDGYIWAYPCGDILGTAGSLQAVQTGANIAYVFTQESD
ncbi:MAG: succinylglutamate desuccinylase/aspartoacylase family protein [Candidatus Thorarchaeota archaeon]|nr:MAG: succinylglutamate desuccinylase/aspartoacylase family protein [Candidatus Thorarchaeota archaeon]